MKPGWKTSEFWVTLAAQVVATCLVAFGQDTIAAAILSAVAALGYNVSRSKVKGGQS